MQIAAMESDSSMTTRLLPAGWQQLTAAGAIASSAKLYTYAAGTSTPKATYSDSALTIPNANPVIANSTGVFGNIFATTGDYALSMKTSADVTLWTADPVVGDAASFTVTEVTGPRTRITAAGSATNIGLDLAGKGTGTVAVRVRDTNAFIVDAAANAANYVQVTGAIAGQPPQISAAGTDANIGLQLHGKGTGTLALFSNGANAMLATNPASAVNNVQISGSATGTAVDISAQGTDANIGINLTPKGTGRVSAKNIAKAWVNFNGSGTVAIRDSFNVSSITDLGVGAYRMNFTTAMVDVNYAIAGGGRFDTTGGANVPLVGAYRTATYLVGSVEISTIAANTVTATDCDIVCVTVLGA